LSSENNEVSDKTETRQEIIDAYLSIVEKRAELPTYSDFGILYVNRDKIRREFGGITLLQEYMRENHAEYLNQHFSSVEDLFSQEKSVENSTKSIFVVTTAVADSKAHVGFLEALDAYSKQHNAQIVIMPCESVTNSFENKTAIFDPVFKDPSYLFVQNNSPLNDNITLCSIQVSAKQLKPITGLQRLGNREGSYVFASPKQFLEYIPSGNSREKNFAIMTPGACTVPSYYTETFVSKRLSYIAEHDHTIGAVIIEVIDDKKFDFRQIQAAEDGSFIDMGVEYRPDGSTQEVEVNIVLGDLHAASVDQDAMGYFLGTFRQFKGRINAIFLHDTFDGLSVNRHIQDITEKFYRNQTRKSSLEEEFKETYSVVSQFDNAFDPKEIVIVKSNHDEFVDRYIKAGKYVEDVENHYTAVCLAKAYLEGFDPIYYGMASMAGEVPLHWNFLSRDSSYVIGGVELGAHGDIGLNGAKSSLSSMEKVFGNCVVAHTHSAAIQRGAFRVGTLSKLDLGYNRVPSSWTQTCAMVYENGQRQLINYIR